jgi:cytochrome P450
MMRVVMDPKGLTLSTGDYIPYGQTVAGPNHAINFSETTYKDPHKFDGFRFSRLREVPGNENKYQFVSTAADSINFGHGVNSCPGRFFASIELKVMLSHLIQNYDIKLNNGGSRPANMYTGTVCRPDMAASILFKAR